MVLTNKEGRKQKIERRECQQRAREWHDIEEGSRPNSHQESKPNPAFLCNMRGSLQHARDLTSLESPASRTRSSRRSPFHDGATKAGIDLEASSAFYEDTR